ncbi:NUDIX hydrolase [Paenibacillus thalictri]|uniref:NUDIX domain-containing protein n=1 Tax=Paenibacillus thalictri TaxID=2527873 RepID=A0A4Q9DXF8_9BACL|nr:NUDIX hydrolase [Paenibacillus thalictri]TBL81096.1 NUDIX domain-containing protein [Paenibacillus thalictri]
MNGYVQQMRELIGHRPLLLCGACVVIFNREDQVLMLRRTDNNCWCFPGGSVELGECVEDAARREVYEETGLRVDHLELFGVFSGPELHYIYPNGDEVHVVDIVFAAHDYNGELTLDEESREAKFVSIADLPADISPPQIPLIKELHTRIYH